MKELKLFFDCEFTSLSPDGQLISIGIVSDSFETPVPDDDVREFDNGHLILKNHKSFPEDWKMKEFTSKSFYAEFSDFQVERCDDWVRENVVKKLSFDIPNNNKGSHSFTPSNHNFSKCVGSTTQIKEWLKKWLTQFKDYEITFVTDCGTYDWYWLVQLLAEWEKGCIRSIYTGNEDCSYSSESGISDGLLKAFMDSDENCRIKERFKVGLPKLPSNISPVPLDLNDLITHKKGISVREAFDLNRCEILPPNEDGSTYGWGADKHNSLADAFVIKEIYNKLI
jgi:hypothetical protein